MARGSICVDLGLCEGLARARVGCAAGVDDVLVDNSGFLKGHMLLTREQVEHLVLLVRHE